MYDYYSHAQHAQITGYEKNTEYSLFSRTTVKQIELKLKECMGNLCRQINAVDSTSNMHMLRYSL